MKKTKLMIGIAATLSVVTIATTTIALTSCSNGVKSKGIFYEKANDPYKELQMMGRSLDYAYFKDPNANNNKYETIAKDVGKKVKNYVSKISTNLANYTRNGEKTVDFKNKSIVFLIGEEYNLNDTSDDNSKINALNEFHMEQPILYSSIYASANAETPGLGMTFPAPRDNSGLSLFDDWFEIGASAYNSGNTNVPREISKAWTNTSDFVVYLYDSSKITQEQEKKLVDFIWNDDSAFNKSDKSYAKRILKKDATIKKVIPLDIQFFYQSIFSVYGTANLVHLFTNLLTDAVDGKLGNDFGGLNEKGGFKARPNNLEALPSLPEFARPEKIKPNAETAPLEFGDKVNLLSSQYNSIAQLVSLGVAPDLSVKINQIQNNTKYHDLPGLMTEKLSSNGSAILNSKDIKCITNSDMKDNSSVNSQNIYCVAADRSSVSKYGADWSLNKPLKPYNSSNISTYMELEHPDFNKLITEHYILTCAYTERNDTEQTQSPYELKLMLPNGNIQNLKTYYNSHFDYITLA